MNQQHDAPEGGAEWKLVPVEPTLEMFEAGDIHELMLPTMAYDRLRAIWDGMIGAAPTRTTLSLCPSCGLDDDLKVAGACGHPDDEICPEPIAPTPLAPSGLVDAVREVDPRDTLVKLGVDTQVANFIMGEISGTQHQQPEWLWYDKTNGDGHGLISWGRWAKVGGQVPYVRGDIVARLVATLSGQQGGAVPAGDLRPGLEEALRVVEAMGPRVVNGVVRYPSGQDVTHTFSVQAEKAEITSAIRARLAEQPAPAGTGADGIEGLRKRVADLEADNDRLEKTIKHASELNGVATAIAWGARKAAKRAALDAGSSEEGRS